MGRNVSCSNHLKNIMFMKKIMMTLATLFVAVCASAQVYIGGGVGFANTSYDDDSKFSWKIAPEIGFQLDKKWDAGISLGYSGVEARRRFLRLLRTFVTQLAAQRLLTSSLRVPLAMSITTCSIARATMMFGKLV